MIFSYSKAEFKSVKKEKKKRKMSGSEDEEYEVNSKEACLVDEICL